MRKLVFSVTALFAIIAGGFVQAADVSAVLAVRSVTSVLSSVGELGLGMDLPQVIPALAIAQGALGIDGPLGGFDTEKPFGIVIMSNKTGFIALPVKNWDVLNKSFVKDGNTVEDLGNDVYKFCVANEDKIVYIKAMGNYAIVSDKQSSLPESVSEYTIKTCEDLTKNYLVSVRMFSSTIPYDERIDAVNALECKLTEELSKSHGDNDNEVVRGIFKDIVARLSQELRTFVGDSPVVTAGVKLDDAKNFCFETAVNADPSTPTGRFFSGAKYNSTNLAGFTCPKAIVSTNVTGNLKLVNGNEVDALLNEIGKELYKAVDCKISDERQNKDVKAGLVTLKNLVAGTINEGRWDFGASLYACDKGVTLVKARYTKDGFAVEDFLGDVLKYGIAENDKGCQAIFQALKTNVADTKGVHIHQLTFPLPGDAPNRDKLVKLLGGETLEIAVGFGQNMICGAIGANAVERLQASVEYSAESKSAAIASFTIDRLAVLKTVAQYCPAIGSKTELVDSFKSMMGNTLKKKSYEKYEVVGIENGIMYRYTASPAALKALGILAKMHTDKMAKDGNCPFDQFGK